MIGERLKKIRKERKITQEELSDVLGVQKSTISQYENGKIDASDEVKSKIAKYFKISLDYLIGVGDEEVEYYDENLFLRLPANILNEDREFLNKFIELIKFKNKVDYD